MQLIMSYLQHTSRRIFCDVIKVYTIYDDADHLNGKYLSISECLYDK